MNKYFYTSALLMFMFCVECGATDFALSNTITREKDPILFKRVYQTFGESATYMVGSNDPNLLYVLAPTNEFVGFYNFSDKSLGSWPLTEAEEITEPAPEYVERKRDYEVPITYDRMEDDPTLGCMGNNPLKYGDIEDDGKKELVVFIKNALQIFSVEQKKVVFSVQLDVDDWHTKEYSKEIISELRGTSESLPEDPQYQSRTYYDAGGASGTLPALRGYAKLYVGGYSAESAKDIVIWRKVYKSNLLKDPVAGFTKLSDTYIHYKLINGEYKKQSTEQSVVKGWLEAKNLTWQKGYPSKSECPGQEGKLIPEMHDPLVNDPDVLK